MNLDPWFITGFVEGEGAFTYQSTLPVFSVRQRRDYTDLVTAIAEFFGVGTVYQCAASGNSQPTVYYRVRRSSELGTVIRHFDRYRLFSRKQQAYEVWKVLVDFKKRGRTYVMRHRQEQRELLDKLTALNCRGRS